MTTENMDANTPADQPVAVTAERKDAYLIVKRDLYYRPNSCGYTGIKDEAGRYTRAEAISYTHPNGDTGPRDGMSFVHEDDAPEFTRACYDDLKADHLTKQRDALAAEVARLREALDLAVSRGCNHCAVSIQKARAALAGEAG